MYLSKKGSVTTITSLKHSYLQMSLGGTVRTIVPPTQMHFSEVIS